MIAPCFANCLMNFGIVSFLPNTCNMLRLVTVITTVSHVNGNHQTTFTTLNVAKSSFVRRRKSPRPSTLESQCFDAAYYMVSSPQATEIL